MILLTVAGVLCHIAYGCARSGAAHVGRVASCFTSVRADRKRRVACGAAARAAPRRLDTSQPVNNYLGIVLYCIVVATCVMTFLQGAHPDVARVACTRSRCALASLAPHAPRRAVICGARAARTLLQRCCAHLRAPRARATAAACTHDMHARACAQFPACLIACRRSAPLCLAALLFLHLFLTHACLPSAPSLLPGPAHRARHGGRDGVYQGHAGLLLRCHPRRCRVGTHPPPPTPTPRAHTRPSRMHTR
jgi:hypothetical protein